MPISYHSENQEKKTRQFWRSALLASATFAFAAPALAQDTSSTNAVEDAAEETKTLDTIVVTGIRQSLKEAAALKQNSSQIVDAIVAEDIGKLPDNNIAEALQRITGVSINSDFGVGEGVSIRGLSENRVELNGRTTVGNDRDGISLDDFPSSFLKTVEVVKSPTADMIEGALGGTVRMNTLRPEDLDGLTIAGSFDAEYADKTENVAPIANVSVGNIWDLSNGAQFGVIGSVSYQDREIRQDEFFNRIRLYDEEVNGLTANTASGRFAVAEQNTVQQFVQQRERTSINLSFQYIPSERGNFYLDLNTTDRSGSESGSSILDVGGSRAYHQGTTQDGNGLLSNYVLEGAFVIPKTFSDFRNTESYSHAFGGEWDFTDDITVSGEFSTSKSESYEPDSEFNLRPINKTNWQAWVAQGGTNFNADRSAFDLRHTIDAHITGDPGTVPSVIYSDGRALLAPENLAVRRFQHDDRRTDNSEDAFRIDVDYRNAFGLDFVRSIKAGARFTKADYEFNHSRYLASNLYRNAFTEDGTPFALWIDDFEAMFPGTFENVNHNNSFNQAGLAGRNDLLNYRIFNGDLLNDPNAVFGMVQQAFAGTNFATTGSLQDNLAVQEGSFRDISEDTSALYLSGEFEFDRLSAIVGARYVKTELSSAVFVDGAKVNGDHEYDDILPSLNATYDLSDSTKLRFAAAKVMRRANYDQLSPAFEIDASAVTAESGAIDLDPFRTTQYDLSVEHYFGDGGLVSFAVFYKDVESFLSSSTTCVAHPETIASQNTTEWENVCLLNSANTTNPNLEFATLEQFAGQADPQAAGLAFVEGQRLAGLTGIRTSKDTNGEKGEVQGFELGYQQQFDFLPGPLAGFGVNANYTYADSEQPNGNQLLNISKNTLNAQLYWENDTFQARLAYNYRDAYLDTEEEKRVENIGALALNSATNDETSASFDPTAGNNYRDDRGQLDFSASWDVNDYVTIATSITNLTGEPSIYVSELGSPWRYREADRRFALGIRAKY